MTDELSALTGARDNVAGFLQLLLKAADGDIAAERSVLEERGRMLMVAERFALGKQDFLAALVPVGKPLYAEAAAVCASWMGRLEALVAKAHGYGEQRGGC